MGYTDIEIPPHKAPEDYTYHERRAEIFHLIIKAGHPDMLSRTELSHRYDVAASTISRDIQAIRDDYAEELTDDAKLITEAFYRKAIKEKVADERYMQADRLLRSYNEWLFETGAIQRADDMEEESVDIAEQWTDTLEAQDPDDVLGLEDEGDDADEEDGLEAVEDDLHLN